ncbi:cation:proton antiporter [Candidatus Woesearchaeota archaeon]|nr:cation:proton antiporter [Candidatus Woesearchaeota archaeon]
MVNLILELGIVMILATFFGFIARALKQPLIPGYIFAGILVGPVLGLVTNSETIAQMSEIGIAFFLFVIGLEITVTKLKDVLSVSLLGGSLQILTLLLFGLWAAYFLGFSHIEMIYIALIVTFSSTMVVIKLLSDKKQLDTLHARIIIGILLLEDLFAVFALSTMSIIENITPAVFLIALFKGAIFLLGAILIIMYVVQPLFRFAAKSQELFLLLSLATCFFFSILALNVGNIMTYLITHLLNVTGMDVLGLSSSPQLLTSLKSGFSIAIGAFVAGVGLANLPYNIEIIGKVKPLKDFFATIFYVSLGLGIGVNFSESVLLPVIMLTLFVVLVKPFVIMLICSIFGYAKKPSFQAAISLTQVSEFSLIIVAQGIVLGQINNDILVIAIALSIITISSTSYLSKYEDWIYNKFFRHIAFFDKISPAKNLEYIPEKSKIDVVVIGYNRIGYSVVNKLKKLRKKLLVVDFNPEAIRALIAQKIPCIYGDISDPEIIERLELKSIKTVISTVSDLADNKLLITKLKHENKDAVAIVTALDVPEALELYGAGADYVILPHYIGGEHVSLLLEDFSKNIKKILKVKTAHIDELQRRHSFGNHHHMNRNIG